MYDNKSFINVINTVNKDNGKTDVFNITFKPGIYKGYNDNDFDFTLFDLKYGYSIINGNGAEIVGKGDYHFITASKYCSGVLNNLTIFKFKTVFFTEGNFLVANSSFINNNVDYYIQRDYGGVVDNSGYCKFVKCSFIGNSAKYGGIAYNTGICEFIGCIDINNTGYSSEGASIYDMGNGVSRFYSSNGTFMVLII